MGAAPGQVGRAAAVVASTRGASRESVAAGYAQGLLADLGCEARLALPDEHPAATWARSGMMWLTGHADADPLMCPAPLAACADGAHAALAALAGHDFNGMRGSQWLGVRAAIAGHARRGDVSPGGSCRLLPLADGVLAVNLAREADWELLPAWLESDVAPDWDAVATALRDRPLAPLLERARLLGLAAAPSVAEPASGPWFEVLARGPAATAPNRRAPRVLDLSSLWAGPLCGQLLRQCGAQVTKVESVQRPDGARSGPRAFFDLLNAGKASVALEFASAAGRAALRQLILDADIVIEASRPRALRQLGIHAEALVRERPGLTWVSLTGYGRAAPCADWIAYGDDAGVAAGLSELMHEATGQRVFVGDAIADPLTGLHAALAAFAAWQSGGGALLALSLAGVAARCASHDRVQGEALRQRQLEWTRIAGTAARPVAPAVHGLARALGADNR